MKISSPANTSRSVMSTYFKHVKLFNFFYFNFQSLEDALKSSSINKKESCLALNLLFQFLFKELRHAQKVQKWFRRKLSLEFEELLTRTTTGKLFDSVKVIWFVIFITNSQ